jgi:hypothetical protein
MKKLSAGEILILLLHAFVGWALCGAVMMIGRELVPINTALIIHAAATPVIYTLLSLFYFKKFAYTSPFTTAFVFLHFVILMDFVVVGLFIEKNFEMFTSPLGTWIPFLLIFLTTLYIGSVVMRKKK